MPPVASLDAASKIFPMCNTHILSGQGSFARRRPRHKNWLPSSMYNNVGLKKACYPFQRLETLHGSLWKGGGVVHFQCAEVRQNGLRQVKTGTSLSYSSSRSKLKLCVWLFIPDPSELLLILPTVLLQGVCTLLQQQNMLLCHLAS